MGKLARARRVEIISWALCRKYIFFSNKFDKHLTPWIVHVCDSNSVNNRLWYIHQHVFLFERTLVGTYTTKNENPMIYNIYSRTQHILQY